MKQTTTPKCKYCWDKGYSTVMSDAGVVKLPCARCPKCQWCGKKYGEHEVDYKDRPILKVPCGLLKNHFVSDTNVTTKPASVATNSVENSNEVVDIEAQIYTELAYMMGVLGASGMPPHQVRHHVEQQGKLLEVVIGQALKEIVICAAIKTKNDEVIRGHRHADAIHTALRMRHELKDLSFADQGFVTSRNRYVSRKEGRELQDAAGIPSVSPEGYMPGTLFSEDLY